MEDTQFCHEYVKRMPHPPKTKSSREMITIVEGNTGIKKIDMFSDIQINRLFPNSVNALVYAYIRENQDLFRKK